MPMIMPSEPGWIAVAVTSGHKLAHPGPVRDRILCGVTISFDILKSYEAGGEVRAEDFFIGQHRRHQRAHQAP
jgi:hypothetical protein